MTSAHLKTLSAIHASLFAPRFRALEEYGEPAPLPPSEVEVVEAARQALKFHRAKEIEVAAEVAQRRTQLPKGNLALLDEAVRVLAHHRSEIERVQEILESLSPQQVAAE